MPRPAIMGDESVNVVVAKPEGASAVLVRCGASVYQLPEIRLWPFGLAEALRQLASTMMQRHRMIYQQSRNMQTQQSMFSLSGICHLKQ